MELSEWGCMDRSIPTDRKIPVAVQFAMVTCLCLIAMYGAYTVISDPEYDLQNQPLVLDEPSAIGLPTSLSAIKSISEIEDLATTESNGASISSIKLERKEKLLAYSVMWSDGRVRYYDATSGLILSSSNSTAQPDNGLPDGFSATISLEQARIIAAERIPLENIIGISLEVDKGQPVYKVNFSGGSLVYVLAQDGTVTFIETSKGVADSVPAAEGVTVPITESPNESEKISSPEAGNSLAPTVTPTPSNEIVPEPEPINTAPLELDRSYPIDSESDKAVPDVHVVKIETIATIDGPRTFIWYSDGAKQQLAQPEPELQTVPE